MIDPCAPGPLMSNGMWRRFIQANPGWRAPAKVIGGCGAAGAAAGVAAKAVTTAATRQPGQDARQDARQPGQDTGQAGQDARQDARDYPADYTARDYTGQPVQAYTVPGGPGFTVPGGQGFTGAYGFSSYPGQVVPGFVGPGGTGFADTLPREPQPVPEPASILVLFVALGATVLLRRRRTWTR